MFSFTDRWIIHITSCYPRGRQIRKLGSTRLEKSTFLPKAVSGSLGKLEFFPFLADLLNTLSDLSLLFFGEVPKLDRSNCSRRGFSYF